VAFDLLTFTSFIIEFSDSELSDCFYLIPDFINILGIQLDRYSVSQGTRIIFKVLRALFGMCLELANYP